MCADKSKKKSDNNAPPEPEAIAIDEHVRRQIEAKVAWYAARLDEIGQRLEELDNEWDADRSIQTCLGGAGLAAGLLGLFSKRWTLIAAGVGGALLAYGLHNPHHPPELIRRFGLRTREEIDTERMALKALRSDFKNVDANGAEPGALAIKALKAAGMSGEPQPG